MLYAYIVGAAAVSFPIGWFFGMLYADKTVAKLLIKRVAKNGSPELMEFMLQFIAAENKK